MCEHNGPGSCPPKQISNKHIATFPMINIGQRPKQGLGLENKRMGHNWKAKKWLFTIYSKNKFSQRKRVSVTVAGEGHVVGTHRDLCHKELGGVLTNEV